MLKSLFLSAAVFIFSTTVALANVTGKWTGTGNYTDNMGQAVDCESVILDVELTPELLTVKQFDTFCGDIVMTGMEFMLEVRGNELVIEDNVVGQITENGMNGAVADEEGSFALDVNIDAEGKMTLKKKATVNSMNWTHEITAELTK